MTGVQRVSLPTTCLAVIGYGLTLTGVGSELLGWTLVGCSAVILVVTIAPNTMECVNRMRQRMNRERLPAWNIATPQVQRKYLIALVVGIAPLWIWGYWNPVVGVLAAVYLACLVCAIPITLAVRLLNRRNR